MTDTSGFRLGCTEMMRRFPQAAAAGGDRTHIYRDHSGGWLQHDLSAAGR